MSSKRKEDWLRLRYVAFFEVPEDQLDNFYETWKERKLTGDTFTVKLPPHSIPELYHGITGFTVFESGNLEKVKNYLAKYTEMGVTVKLFPLWEDEKLGKELHRFNKSRIKAKKEWEQTSYPKITDWGTTKRLSVLPLIDWKTDNPKLRVETGVSYLIKTDNHTILFDLGLNKNQEDPSPLLHNMNQLGITLKDIDIIVISHNHGDHTGGIKWTKDHTFSFTGKQLDLTRKTVYTPVPMTYPGLKPIHSKAPTIIDPGVATIGTISNAMFFSKPGLESEQALAVNVEGKGLVIIIGCGHQTLPKIIKRTETMFDEPIYGIIGGLHLPVEGGPIEILGMTPYKYLGTGKPPWQHYTPQDVRELIELLKKRNPQIVALSPHDSSQFSMDLFHQAFPQAYRDIKVGKEIII